MRRTILLGTYAAHATPGPATITFEARKHIATFGAIERDITRRSFEQWLPAKPVRRQEGGPPRDIVTKLNAALGLLHKHMA
jgi:hypothetical protein